MPAEQVCCVQRTVNIISLPSTEPSIRGTRRASIVDILDTRRLRRTATSMYQNATLEISPAPQPPTPSVLSELLRQITLFQRAKRNMADNKWLISYEEYTHNVIGDHL